MRKLRSRTSERSNHSSASRRSDHCCRPTELKLVVCRIVKTHINSATNINIKITINIKIKININIKIKINSYINININIDTTLLMMISVKKAMIRAMATKAAMLVIPGHWDHIDHFFGTLIIFRWKWLWETNVFWAANIASFFNAVINFPVFPVCMHKRR